MRTLTIDFDKAFDGLASIVDRFGGEHKPKGRSGGIGCTYAEETAAGYLLPYLVPVCIVGQFLADLGILAAVLPEEGSSEQQYGACVAGSTIWENAEAMGVTFTDEAKTFLRMAQAEQDSGKAWGDSLQEAVTQFVASAHEEVDNKFRSVVGRAKYVAPEAPLAEWERELLYGDEPAF